MFFRRRLPEPLRLKLYLKDKKKKENKAKVLFVPLERSLNNQSLATALHTGFPIWGFVEEFSWSWILGSISKFQNKQIKLSSTRVFTSFKNRRWKRCCEIDFASFESNFFSIIQAKSPSYLKVESLEPERGLGPRHLLPCAYLCRDQLKQS